MLKKIIVFVLFVSFATPVLAVGPKNSDYQLPANAKEIAPNVFSLGKAYDKKSDSFVEGYAIVHKKGDAKSAAARSPKGGTATCYGFMATGAKWKSVENWTAFAGPGLTADFVLANTANNIAKWEAASGVADILGTGSLGNGTPTDPNILDDKNEVSFGNLDQGTIAVTTVWGNFGGPTSNRQLVAWDQVFNTDYVWTTNAAAEPTKMDFENISTHELGHAVGMGDIYNSSCSEVTMYGYGIEGEIKKRDLAPADVLGISTLY